MPLRHLSGSAALPAYTRATSGCGRINRPSAIASITKATSSRHHGVVAAQLLAHRVAASMAPRRAAEVSEAAQLPLVLGRAPWGRERAGGDRIVGGTAEPNRAGPDLAQVSAHSGSCGGGLGRRGGGPAAGGRGLSCWPAVGNGHRVGRRLAFWPPAAKPKVT